MEDINDGTQASNILIELGDCNDPAFGHDSEFVISKVNDGKILIKKFEDIKVSTMTVITLFSREIVDSEAINYLLPVVPVDSNQIPGDITSIRFNGKCRGVKGKFFKNSAFVDIYTGEKMLSTKLSKKKIQMCGSKSLDMGRTASKFIVDHINEAITFIKKVRSESQLYYDSVSWLIENSRGKPLNVSTQSVMGKFNMLQTIDDYYLSFPSDDIVPDEYVEFVRLIRYRLSDIKYHCELIPVLQYYTTIDPSSILGESINESKPESSYDDIRMDVIKVGRSMVNYNYKLGFFVDRFKLSNILKERGMGVQLINTVNSYIRVEMSSDIPDDEYVIRRKGTHSKQLFLIYMSGSVMHSGPGGECMANCYYNFMLEIAQFRDDVTIVV